MSGSVRGISCKGYIYSTEENQNSLGTEVPGRKFQLRLMQMKFSSLQRAPQSRDGTGIGEARSDIKV